MSVGLVPSDVFASLPGPEPTEPSPIDIRGLASAVLRRWKFILAVPLLFLGATFLGLKALPPVYQASVELLMFDPHQSEPGGVAAPSATSQTVDAIAINTEIEVLQSQSLLVRVVRDLKLYDRPEFQTQSRATEVSAAAARLRDWFIATFSRAPRTVTEPAPAASAPSATADGRIEEAAAILSKKLKVDRSSMSYVLWVSATSQDAQLAQRISTALVDDYLASQMDAERRTLDQLALWLEGKLSELKERNAQTQTTIENPNPRMDLLIRARKFAAATDHRSERADRACSRQSRRQAGRVGPG